jgi:hypothetical protein
MNCEVCARLEEESKKALKAFEAYENSLEGIDRSIEQHKKVKRLEAESKQAWTNWREHVHSHDE